MPPKDAHFSSLRIAIGAFHLRAIPLGDGRMAYDIRDRLFSGSALRGDADATSTTDDILLELADHTIVYPSRATETVSISIIAQEARLGMIPLDD